MFPSTMTDGKLSEDTLCGLVNYGCIQYILHIKLSEAGVCTSQQHNGKADGCIWSDHRGVFYDSYFFFFFMYAGQIFLSAQSA